MNEVQVYEEIYKGHWEWRSVPVHIDVDGEFEYSSNDKQLIGIIKKQWEEKGYKVRVV